MIEHFEKTLKRYLAGEAMDAAPVSVKERPMTESCLDLAAARRYLAEVEDSVNFEKHDRRYHGGRFDPATMTCQMRNALEEGDLADVIRAERDEAALLHKKQQEENKKQEEARRQERDRENAIFQDEERLRIVCDHPELATEEEFVAFYGKTNKDGAIRLLRYLCNRFVPAYMDGGGTRIGHIAGMPVFPHNMMDGEMSRSRNSHWLRRKAKDLYYDKIRIIRSLPDFMNRVKGISEGSGDHESRQHCAWQVAKGFVRAEIEFNGNPWWLILTRTADDRLLLYDVVNNPPKSKTKS